MIVELNASATPDEVAAVVGLARTAEHEPAVVTWPGRTFVVQPSPAVGAATFVGVPGVVRVVETGGPHHLAHRRFAGRSSVVRVGVNALGAGDLTVIAGPCAVEGPAQLARVASAVADAGAGMLRGGAFKPRTSPYAFQGLGEPALLMLAEQRARTGLPIVTEVVHPGDVALVARYADVLQIGTRNMQNYALLAEAGRCGRPILLKRGMAATVQEWVLAAEYVLAAGNPDVILCERGIRTFESAGRFTLDLTAIPAVKRLTHLPVIADPSHAAGHAYLVPPLALAAVAAGADGVMVDVHAAPRSARCDAGQALTPADFKSLVVDLERVTAATRMNLTAA